MRLLYLPAALVLLCAVGAASQEKAPDLSGVWRWNALKSISSPAAPIPNDVRVKIEQNGPDLLLTWRLLTGANELMQTSYFRIGSDDNRNIGTTGVPIKSNARWQGAALAIDSLPVPGNEGTSSRELWTLKDGQTLVFKGQRPSAGERAGEHSKEDTIVFERQADATWGPPQKILAAGQVYQNIQIIKEPAWRLPSVMMSLTRWLGVDCAYCHTLNEYEKDDKLPKNVARQMFKMVHDINEDNFPGTGPGNFKVTCWTCHRGGILPETAAGVAGLKPSGK
jgi:hypothetical protein